MTKRILELQNLVNEQIENMAKYDTEKERTFFYKEYLRIKKILDEEMDNYAKGLANFDIL